MPNEKMIAFHAYSIKKYQINNISLYLKKLEKIQKLKAERRE